MRRFFNKLAAGVMVATMAFTALAPVTTMAAEASFDCDHPAISRSFTKEPTCTEDGTYDKICSICGVTLEKGLTYKALGHSYTEATTENGKVKNLLCERCGKSVDFTPTKDEKSCKHDNVITVNAKNPDCENDGYSGDEICTDCGKVITAGSTLTHTGHNFIKGSIIEEETCTTDGKCYYYCDNCGEKKIVTIPASHKWNEGTITLAPTTTTEGKKEFKCTVCGATKTETLAKLSTGATTPGKDDKKPSTSTTPSTSNKDNKDSDTTPIKETLAKVGTKYTIGGNQYTVIKAGEEVRFSKANAKKKSVTIPFSKANAKKKSITIPAIIKADGISYKVTEVGANAFKNNKNVKKVVIGANVVKIANKAFNKCPNLKSVVIKTTLLTKKTASKKCFSKVNKKMVIKVSKKSKKTYAKIFKGLKVR